MEIKIETLIDVTQEGYKMLKHFSVSDQVPRKCNYNKLEDLTRIGLIFRGDDPDAFYLTLLGEHLLSCIEQQKKDSIEFLYLLKQWENEGN